VYEGPGLLGRIKRELVAHLDREGLGRASDLTGRRAAEWAAKRLEG
jgi:dihydroorotate dehydrogenase